MFYYFSFQSIKSDFINRYNNNNKTTKKQEKTTFNWPNVLHSFVNKKDIVIAKCLGSCIVGLYVLKYRSVNKSFQYLIFKKINKFSIYKSRSKQFPE